MKKINYIFCAIAICFTFLTSCEKDRSEDFFDVNGGQTIGAFNNAANSELLVSPTDDFDNVVTVGVSTVSGADRTATVSIDPSSTLDPAIYTLESTTVTIPAGSFIGTVNITTVAGSAFNPSDVLIINLDSVENGVVLDNANTVKTITFSPTVGCNFIVDQTVGTWTIVQDDFGTSVGDNSFEVVAGPGENQVTMINPFDHTNPDTGGGYDIIIDIAPNSGAATINRQAAWHCDGFGCGFGEGRVNSNPAGTNKVLTCEGSMEFLLQHTVDAGSFGSFTFRATKN